MTNNESAAHNPPIIDVYWEGPYTLDNIDSIQEDVHCLYQVYGLHPVYGTNTLLYIGKTEKQSGDKRIKQHSWISNQADECKIYVATCGNFSSWKDWKDDKRDRYLVFKETKKITISNLESLLIYAHQPSYNSKSLKSTHFADNAFRIFNSGSRVLLLPEVSTQFYADPNMNRPEIEQC